MSVTVTPDWTELDSRLAEPEPGVVDVKAATRAVSDLLVALGQDPGASLMATPGRVARAYAEMLTPAPIEATTFPNVEGYDELVTLKNIRFSSVCEHHLLPFSGVAHIAYLPRDRLIGLSKLARVVGHFASRLQIQERLTTQVSSWLVTHLEPRGVGVVIEAEHGCMTLRGPRSEGARTATSSFAGLLRDDERHRTEFLTAISGH